MEGSRMLARRIRKFAPVLIAALALLSVPASAMAAPSDLDPSFGSGGIVNQLFSAGDGASGSTLALQPDGKIVVTGTAFAGSPAADFKTYVARYNSNGSLDTSFGAAGFAYIDYSNVPSAYEESADIAIGPGGRIVVVGYVVDTASDSSDTTVSVLLSSGAPDSGFDGDGKRLQAFGDAGTDDSANSVAVSPDGSIVVAGLAHLGSDDDAMLFRLTATGSPEPSFYGGGTRFFDFSQDYAGSDDVGLDVKLQADGRIVLLASYMPSASDEGLALRRVLASGSDDPSWAAGTTDSSYFSPLGDSAYPRDFEIQPGGKFVVVVNTNLYGTRSIAVQRILENGTGVDVSFGSGGVATYAPPEHDLYTQALALTGDGGLLIGGRAQDSPSMSFLLRLTPNGAPVTTFGANGLATLPGKTTITSAAVQQDGHYLGLAYDGANGYDIKRLIGDYVAPVPPAPATQPTIPLTAKIKSPSKSKMKASKFRSVSGTALGTGIAKVQFAIQRIDSKLLKKKKRCLYVKNKKGATKSYKAKKKKCTPAKFLTAKGTTSWKYALRLKPGKYKLYVRAVGTDGGKGKFVTKTFKLTK